MSGESESAIAWTPRWDSQEDENAAFIAAARTDIPHLVREVRILQAHVANWESWADHLTPTCCCGNCGYDDY